ncbi:hypothetical protein HDU76_002080 [Blyttiomyces sp. JEL0837]|nr:hypothetical protein HDU76_002080 [Blyttiomyces sp. JEL0837]
MDSPFSSIEGGTEEPRRPSTIKSSTSPTSIPSVQQIPIPTDPNIDSTFIFDNSQFQFLPPVFDGLRKLFKAVEKVGEGDVEQSDLFEFRKAIEESKQRLHAMPGIVSEMLRGSLPTVEEQEKEYQRKVKLILEKREQLQRYRELPIFEKIEELKAEMGGFGVNVEGNEGKVNPEKIEGKVDAMDTD